jgi:hypothetical protein
VKLEGTARPSFARFILEHQEQYQLEDKELGYIAGRYDMPTRMRTQREECLFYDVEQHQRFVSHGEI